MNPDPDPLVEGFAKAIYEAAWPGRSWERNPSDAEQWRYYTLGRAALAFALTRAVAIMGRVPTPEPGEGERFAG